MSELPKTFGPAAIEARWYAHWEERGLFRPERDEREPFTIVMPPPNVTGSLHIGHALDITLQDILVRHARMRGKDSLWVVGTDHAGIATQMVVERQLNDRQQKRTDFTRDEFIAKVWEWKAESGGQITRQLRRLGASCDWANERFTMDEGFSKAVTHVFVELHKRGLLYRDKRLVNWDPHFQTAISDLEVETRDVAGKFWTLRYPLEDGSGAIEVATTRPETMLADMAVAVHPEDGRYTAMVGKKLRHPLTGRRIPMVPDEHADPELGSGAVKITPGHDFNDFEVGKRAGFKPADMLNMFDGQAKVVQCGGIPEELLGMDRFNARKRVVELLEADGALVKVEDRVVPTPFGDRSGVVIEPWLTDQWYVDAAKLAAPVLEATRDGKIRIVPETWKKTWFNWLENIQPWCVSRQLWWGHRIPAWYGFSKEWLEENSNKTYFEIAEQVIRGSTPGGKIFVAESEEALLEQAVEYYGPKIQVLIFGNEKHQTLDGRLTVVLSQDEDVLDTWFSSALWPFATLGWPEDFPSLSREGPGVGDDEAGSMPGSAFPAVSDESSGAQTRAPTPAPPLKWRGSDLARHYPSDVLISGFDILFFWDARMAMQGIEFMGEPPWKTLYLHGLVRDAAGQKMSKSKGNTVDPLGLIDKYGADALRFTLAAMESQGRDIKLDEKRVEGYRNFATKLWNAARFLQMNGVGASQSIAAPEAELPVNRWIIGEVVATLAKLDKAYEQLRFDDMADAIYHFVWDNYCDWYVELIKGELTPQSAPAEPVEASLRQAQGERENAAAETRAVAAWAFDQILVMLHPLMPFITEELWGAMGERPYELIVAKWPAPSVKPSIETAELGGDILTVDYNKIAKSFVEWTIEIISQVRTLRAEMNIPWTATLTPVVVGFDPGLLELLEDEGATFARLAKLGPPLSAEVTPPNSAQMVVKGTVIAFPLEGAIDLDAERMRLSKSLVAVEKDRDGLAARLANPAFAERAKPEAVEKARADHDAKAAEAERLRAALERLG